MNYCDSCKLTIQNQMPHCPLCGSRLRPLDERFEFDFPLHPMEYEKSKWRRILAFGSIVVATVCILVALLTASTSYWLLIILSGLVYLGLSLQFIRKSRRNIGLLALIQVFGVSLLSFAVDWATGYYQWSTNYVIPFVIISALGLLTLVLFLRPRRFRDYILYQLGLSIIGIVVSVVLILDHDTIAWSGIVGAAYCGLTIVGILVFTARKTKKELQKRFHF